VATTAYIQPQQFIFSGDSSVHCWPSCSDGDVYYAEAVNVAQHLKEYGCTRLHIYDIDRLFGIQVFSSGCDTVFAEYCWVGPPYITLDFDNTMGNISLWFASEILDTVYWWLEALPGSCQGPIRACQSPVGIQPPPAPAKYCYWNPITGIFTDSPGPGQVLKKIDCRWVQ